MEDAERYRAAFADWLACAAGGTDEPAARAAVNSGDRVLWLATTGHVLDFDDTYSPGLAHCTAPTAPAALVVGAEQGATMHDVLRAYARGFEAMAAVARASHPALYEGGWHPTSVCGVIGSAVAAACMLEADADRALALVLLRGAGLLSAFGTDMKSLQVGMAAAAGARGARLASAGADVLVESVLRAFEEGYGATWSDPDPDAPAIHENWIKAYPCCLQTHSSIEAADEARSAGAVEGRVRVRVHPLSMRAAPYGVPATSLEAKFSIPYTVAFTLLHGPPTVRDFGSLYEPALRVAGDVDVEGDPGLGQSDAVLVSDGRTFGVTTALGSPERPMSEEQLAEKRRSLAATDPGEWFDAGTSADDVVKRLLD